MREILKELNCQIQFISKKELNSKLQYMIILNSGGIH
jgi:hypothetical protein